MSPVGEASSIPRIRRFLGLVGEEDLLRRWAEAESLTEDPFSALYAVVLEHSWVNLRESMEVLERLRRAEAARLGPRDRARLDRLEANVRRLRGELETSIRLYRRADAAFAAQGEVVERARGSLGWIDSLMKRGETRRALDLADETLRRLPAEHAILRAKLEYNRAICLLHLFGWERTRRAYLRTLEILRPLGVPELLMQPLFGLGLLHRERGEPEKARAYYEELLRIGRRAGIPRAIYGARMGLNLVEWTVGDWVEAAREAEEVERGLEEVGEVNTLAVALYNRSQILTALGAVEKAEKPASRAYRIAHESGSANLSAMTAIRHGQVLHKLGRYHDAAQRFREAGAILSRLRQKGDQRMLAAIEGEALLDRGLAQEAARRLRPLLRPIRQEASRELGAVARGLLAEIHLKEGRSALALRLARKAHRENRGLQARAMRPRFALTIAGALSAQGRHPLAVRWLRRAVDEIQEQEARLGEMQLLRETARSRAGLHRRLVEVAGRSGGRNGSRLALDLLGRLRTSGQAAELLDRREDPQLRRLRAAVTGLRDKALTATGARSEALEDEISALERRMERSLGRLRRRTSTVASEEGAARWLGRLGGGRLVMLEEEASGWCAYVADSPRAVRRVELPEAAARLQGTWLSQRLLFEAAARTPAKERRDLLERTREESVDALRRLHEALWAPLELDDRPVHLVASGALHGLPLEALPWAEPGVDRPAISRLPRPGVLGRLPRRRRGEALLLGGRGEGVRQELREVRRSLKEAGLDVRTGRRRRDLDPKRQVGVLHVAAHGVFHRRHWLLSGIELEDGWLGFEQLGRGRLDGALLFLSSCESGMARDLPGAEMDGWLSAGLAAGVGEMVLALWKVDDEAATAFSRLFYQEWTAKRPAAEAAARARSRLLEEPRHPWQWAPWLAMS